MSTPSNFFPGNESYNQLFTDIAIDKRQVEQFVVQQFPQLSFFNKLSSALGSAEVVKSGQRKFEIYRRGNPYPAATVANKVSNADGTITLYWDDPNFDSLRKGNAIASTSGAWGLVLENPNGSARVQFLYSPIGSAGFVAGDFAKGSVATDRGDVSQNQNSGSKERIIFKPFQTYNVIGLYRDTAELTMDEMNTLTFIANVNGTPYYALTQTMDMLERAAMIQEVRTISAPRIEKPETDQYVGGGFEWQIKNQGGVWFPIYEEVNPTALQSMIDQLISNNGMVGDEILVVAGSSWVGAFQRNVALDLVQYPGIQNTIGGVTVKGINAMTYGYNGKTLKIVINPLFNNSQAYPEVSTILNGTLLKSHSAFFFDTSRVQTQQGSVPFLRKYYFGAADMFMSKLNGLVDMDGKVTQYPTNSSLSARQEIVYSCTTQLMNPAAHGYMYLAS